MLKLFSLFAAAVIVGYYGPADPAHPIGGTVWQGAQLAFEEAGEQFELVQEWDENPWSGGAAGVVRMVYENRAVAILGSINGDATHLAEQVVAKALLPLVDPASTDRTVNAAFVPWMFSVMPDDRALMRVLAAALPDEPFVLVTSTAHDSRITTGELQSALGTRYPARHIQFERTNGVAADVASVGVKAVAVIAPPVESAALVRDLRAAVPDVKLYGSHHFGRLTFLERAGEAAEGVVFPLPSMPAPDFAEKFQTRYGHPPDFAAAHAYDAARLLIEAIRTAGPDRDAVREALLELSPYNGASGPITWDDLRRNSRPPILAEFRSESTSAAESIVPTPVR